VANLINLFNPGMVIFGGMLRDMYPGWVDQVRARIAANVLPVARERVQLRTSALGDDATLVGAAELGFAPLLENPIEVVRARTARADRAVVPADR
jgi:predicted NBD/HSP70 family sugar kinase